MLARCLLCFATLLFCCQPLSAQFSPDSSSEEWIAVYFNQPADHSVALGGNTINDDHDLIGTLEEMIDRATTSVDLAIYDLEHPRIGRALSRAAKRGVRVRLVTDNYNRTDSRSLDQVMWAILAKANILSIDDDGDIYLPDGSIEDHDLTNDGAQMHHKFAVIDAITADPNDDYVWTGSTNMTYTGAYNTNNTVVIKDNEVAAAYLAEFEQMWGGSGDRPDPARARFHKDKRETGEHLFHVGGIRVEIYFAPVARDDSKPSISDRLVRLIREEAQNDINFQAFAITPSIPMSRAMWDLSAEGSVELNGVIDRSFYYRYKKSGAIWASPEAKVANRRIVPSNEIRKLHHKILILDAYHPDPADQAVVVTGSYNFSKSAEQSNDENLLIIHSDRIANLYFQDFMGVMNRAVGKRAVPQPKIYTDRTYDPYRIIDGRSFQVAIVPGFGFPVGFLGVRVPTLFAGNDSSQYFADDASFFVTNLLNERTVKLFGPGGEPVAANDGVLAYVTILDGDRRISLNRQLLINGYGTYSDYYAQHPDSVKAFRRYEAIARRERRGMWKQPDKIGRRFPRSQMLDDETAPVIVSFPIDLNTASVEMLQMLPGIGPAYAKRIIQYREVNGSFSNTEELLNIKGIGPKTLEKLRPMIVLE